ncbi:MAG: hypothetical protein AAGK21_04965 [Bacteroidota bacterium]
MLRLLPLALLALGLTACDTTRSVADPSDGFDPSAINYDAVTSLDYNDHVRPLLAARAVLGGSNPADYDLMDVVMAGPSGFVVPFDAEGSLMLRFVEDLPDDAEIPFPNLRNLEADEQRYLARWIEGGARDGDMTPFADATNLLFAGVQAENHIAIIDAESLRLIRRIYFDDHGIESYPYGPHHFAFEGDGSAAYVSLVSAGVVAKVSLDMSMDPSDPGFLLGRTAEGTFATPGMLSLDPSTSRLFVGRSTLSDPLASGFGILDRETMAVETVDTPFNVPHAMAATPDGRFAITAELTGTQSASRALVYDAETGDASLVVIPTDGQPREFIHFSILGAHHMGGHGGMDHGGMGHSMATYPYTVTLTSRSTDEVLFFTLSEDGDLAFEASFPAGDGPYHAHANHDGSAILIPDQRGDAVSILDADTREMTRSVQSDVLSQPHSPAPAMDGSRFFVTSSNLNGAWTADYLFHNAEGTAQGAESFGNLAAFSPAGELLGVVQLGEYPSGLEPVMLPGMAGGMDHGSMDHDGMDHGSMDHDGMDH